MSLGKYTKRLFGVLIAFSLLIMLACGSAEDEPTPTPAQVAPVPTPTIIAGPTIVLPTPTPTTPAGVTAAPQPTNTPTAAPLPGEQPVYGGTINMGENDTAGTGLDLSGGRSGYGWGSLGLVGNVYGQLLRVSPNDRVSVEMDMVRSWSAGSDGKSYTFELIDGITDHEGNPFTIEDAWYSIARMKERPNGLLVRRQGCIRTYMADVWDDDTRALLPNAGVEVTGPNQLTVRLDAPRGAFIPCFAGAWSALAPDTYIKPIDESPDGTTRGLDFGQGEVIGTGPFKLTEFEVSNFMRFERFDDFFRDGLPYLDGYTIFAIPDSGSKAAAYMAGRIDFMGIFGSSTPTPADLQRIKDRLGADKVRDPIVLANGWRGADINVTRPPFGPIDDPTAMKIRQAIQLNADRNEMNILAHDGIGHIATPYFIGWNWIYTEEEWFANFPGLDSSPEAKARDRAKAQELMREAGYGPDNPLTGVEIVCSTSNRRDCEVFEAQLKHIWINADLIISSGTAVNTERQRNGDYDLTWDSIGLSFQDPDGYHITFFKWQDGGRNYTGYVNPSWMELYEQQVALTSNEERAPILREMAQIFWDDAHLIGHVRPGVIGIYPSKLRGWTPCIIHTCNYVLEEVWIAE